jgi:pseudo-response regulator 7
MRSKLRGSHFSAEVITKREIGKDEEEGRDEEGTGDQFEEGDGVIAEAVIQQSKLQQNLQHSKQQQQQQQQVQSGPSAGGWESFLPHSQLRVLLAEDDDCTRHVVSALLRNCNYEG